MEHPGGGLKSGDCLLKKGDLANKPILRCTLLATVKMWTNKWYKNKVAQEIMKNPGLTAPRGPREKFSLATSPTR